MVVSSKQPAKGIQGFALQIVLAFSVTFASGCASNLKQSAKSDAGFPPAPPPLADPTGQALEIALETARLAEERGMDREAIDAYLNVRNQQPNRPGVAHALAVLYDRTGRVDAAAAEYTRALEEEPKDADLHCDYGYFLYSSSRLDEAEASYRRALELAPHHRQTQVNLGVLLAYGGKDKEAM